MPVKQNKNYHDESLRTGDHRTLQTLTERQKETICYFFGIGIWKIRFTLEDIARKFDLTTERVRQIQDKAIPKLRGNNSVKFALFYIRVYNEFFVLNRVETCDYVNIDYII